MMALGELYLGLTVGSLTLLSPKGRELKISNKQLARSERTASGKYVRDIIATKKKFSLSYELIDEPDRLIYKNFYDEENELVFRMYTGDGTTYNDYTVLMEPFDYERILMFDGGLWGNFDVVLEEV